MKYRIGLMLLVCFSLLFTNCDDDETLYIPKPKGYMHQVFPEKKYLNFDTLCPYRFEYPSYSLVVFDKRKSAEPCWLNIVYPKFNAVLYISYKSIKSKADLNTYVEENRSYTVKHQVKATSIKEQMISDAANKKYGMAYLIGGNAASPCQFYLTDSLNHFVRASLYFNSKPNADSLAPTLEFIKKDIDRLIKTLKWK